MKYKRMVLIGSKRKSELNALVKLKKELDSQIFSAKTVYRELIE